MKIKLVGIGKMRNPHLKALVDMWGTRITHMIDFEFLEINDGRANDGEKRLDEEALKISKLIDGGGEWILLDEKGVDLDSLAFSKLISNTQDEGIKILGFVVGSSHGIQAKLKTRFKKKIRFGSMTWPHEVVRALLSEQIYRGLCILRNIPYHH